jgi:hypothetical protein
MTPVARARLRVVLSLLLIVPLGLAMKYYTGPARGWVNNWGSSLPYEIAWMLAIFFLIPRRWAIPRIAVGVFATTCVIELLQLWHPPFLQAIRAKLPGRLVLGTTFNPSDFAAYAVGCALGAAWLYVIAPRSSRR